MEFLIPAKLLGTDIGKLGLKETQLIVQTEITNPTVFPFRFKETTYRFNLDGKEFAEGHINTAVNLPAHGKAVLDLPMEVSLKEGLKAGLKMLTKPEKVNYSFTFRTKMADKKGSNTFQDSGMVTMGQGNLKELVDAARAQGNKEDKAEKDKKDKNQHPKEK